MKNDSSRHTFDARKHYSSVRMQQGRAQLDADWNEQGDIFAHRVETEASDIIGLCGGPLHNAAFHIVADIKQLTAAEQKLPENKTPPAGFKAPDFLISAGRYYVDGILCANEQLTSYANQPDLPAAAPIKEAGLYLIYLDVWQRHLTALDDPGIREVALGGPDTAARTKTIWQVKHWFAGESTKANCLTKFADYEKLIAPSDGKLSARPETEQASADPCIVPPGAGYRGLENQLYRVEIHQGGAALDATSGGAGTLATRVEGANDQLKVTGGKWQAGQAVEIFSSQPGSDPMNGTLAYVTNFDSGSKTVTLNVNVSQLTLDELRLREVKATYKWSRDNGVVVTTIESINGQEVTVHDLGPDAVLGFKADQWVEIIDDNLELHGLPGQLAQIAEIDQALNLITLNYAPTPLAAHASGVDKARHPKLRRWDGIGAVKFHPSAAVDQYLDLESGAQVRFFAGAYKTGDYWTIPARTATADTQSGNIEWPQVANAPAALLPFGIQHHYCRLAMLRWDGKEFTVVEDCRKLFPPITELTSLFYVSGDGQEAMPNDPLPQLLQVSVFNGSWPVAGAQVRFTAQGNGRLAANLAGLPASTANTLVVTTGADGIASCAWRLEPDVTKPSQQVEARLLDVNLDALPPVVRFNGNLSIADQVFYDAGACATLQEQKTVQQALDRLAHLSSLYPVSGNGQEAMPGAAIEPLVVLVSNACGPVTDGKALVRFKVVAGAGTVNGASEAEVATDANGQAQCAWTLDATTANQQVEASLVEDPTRPTVPPTSARFHATLSLASHVAYDPKNCPALAAAGVTTVQEAIDNLCRIEPGGGCEVTVGEGGQFARLDEALRKLLEERHRNICICLLPGDHELAGGLVVADKREKGSQTHVKIEGCGLGSRLHLRNGPLTVGPLDSFTLRRVAATTESANKLIHCIRCNEVSIEDCHLYIYLGSSLGSPDLLTIEHAKFIRVTGNFLSSLWLGPDTFKLFKIPPPQPLSTQPLGFLADELTRNLAGAEQRVREQFVAPYQDFMRANQNISPAERASIESAIRIILSMGQRNPEAGLAQETEAVRALYYGNALILMDANADTLIENNRFTGRIMLYGNTHWLSDNEWKSFAKKVQSGAIALTKPLATLQIRSNHLSGICIDRSVAEPPDRKELPGLYNRCLFGENWSHLALHHILAHHLNIGSNQFNLNYSAKFDAATVAGRSAIVIGNAAPNPTSPLFYGVAPAAMNMIQAAANLLEVRSL